MRKKRNIDEKRIAILKAQLNELQAKFDLFLENSSQTENPEHRRILNDYIRKITKLKNEIDKLSK
ncbi:MAG: hypothetical protein IKE91_02230 [Clostridia bacterium]|nr:hypothetical protein [Clostridia bacterium]